MLYSAGAGREARVLAKDFLPGRLDEVRTAEFVVMVSEIVANAVLHGTPEPDGRIGLRLEAETGVARAVVTDAAPEFTFDRDTVREGRPRPHGPVGGGSTGRSLGPLPRREEGSLV